MMSLSIMSYDVIWTYHLVSSSIVLVGVHSNYSISCIRLSVRTPGAFWSVHSEKSTTCKQSVTGM